MSQSKIKTRTETSCFRVVDGTGNQCECGKLLIKNGKTKYGKQRFFCLICKISKVESPTITSYGCKFDKQIVQLKKEGLGMRSTARVLGISPATVIRRIVDIADRIAPPPIPPNLERVQVDELHTFIGRKSKEVYVIYSWSQELKRVLSMTVGTRSKVNLRLIVNPLLEAEVQSINTDKYSGYKGVVPIKKHTTFKRRNNGIERQNLTLRTHLKRLNRRTICFSKSLVVLVAVLKIYCWS